MVDLWPPKPATLTAEKLALNASDLGTAKDSTGSVSISFSPNGKGSFSASGQLGVNPLSIKAKLKLADTEVTSMQPYFADRIKVRITDGRVAADDDISLGYSPAKGFRLKYGGDVFLTRFASVDRVGAEDFLKWGTLGLRGMDVSYGPNYVTIKEVSLTDFYSNIIVNPDLTLNVVKVFEQPSEKAAGGKVSPPVQAQTWPVKVGKVTLRGGRINITDRSVKPTFSAILSKMGGEVTGLSSEEIKMADVVLKGTYDNSATINVAGKINPLRKDLYVFLKVKLDNMELSPLTPYSGKYLGYTIQKGKLSLDLQYLIDKKKLDSRNRLFMDQLTLGERVEGPDATKLPVKLAIALLRDRHGEIHLDMPVTGSTDDPKFSVGKVVIQVIWNVITKAATSPFALLGAIFGGGEELGYVEFDYGGHALDSASVKKLDTLAKALNDRPALKLSIEGHVDVEKDKEGLRQYILDRKLKARKLKDMLDDDKPAIPVDDVTIEANEYEKYLKMVYKEEDFKKPRNIIGFAKSQTAPEMERLLRASFEVGDDDLRQLSSQRAGTVKDYVIGTGKVAPERVFLMEPKALSPEKPEKPEKKEGLKASRVVFILD
jgi:hypothetical protein